MKVYVVTHWYRYENETVLEVCATEAIAWSVMSDAEKRGDGWRKTESGYTRSTSPQMFGGSWDAEGYEVSTWIVRGHPRGEAGGPGMSPANR